MKLCVHKQLPLQYRHCSLTLCPTIKTSPPNRSRSKQPRANIFLFLIFKSKQPTASRIRSAQKCLLWVRGSKCPAQPTAVVLVAQTCQAPARPTLQAARLCFAQLSKICILAFTLKGLAKNILALAHSYRPESLTKRRLQTNAGLVHRIGVRPAFCQRLADTHVA